MKPYVIAHMASSLDGRVDATRWSAPPSSDAGTGDAYDRIHEQLAGDAWICGRVTMEQFLTGRPHPMAQKKPPSRTVHVAKQDAGQYAIALDPSGKLHWAPENSRKEHFIVLLASTVPDTHLQELVADGVSYIVSAAPEVDLAVALDVLNREFGIRRLLLEGGGVIVGSMLKAGLVDEFSLVLYPAVDGHSGDRSIVEAGELGVGGDLRLSLQGVERLEADVVWLRYGVANSRQGGSTPT